MAPRQEPLQVLRAKPLSHHPQVCRCAQAGTPAQPRYCIRSPESLPQQARAGAGLSGYRWTIEPACTIMPAHEKVDSAASRSSTLLRCIAEAWGSFQLPSLKLQEQTQKSPLKPLSPSLPPSTEAIACVHQGTNYSCFNQGVRERMVGSQRADGR